MAYLGAPQSLQAESSRVDIPPEFAAALDVSGTGWPSLSGTGSPTGIYRPSQWIPLAPEAMFIPRPAPPLEAASDVIQNTYTLLHR